MNIINLMNQVPLMSAWQTELKTGGTRQLLTGLSGSAKTLAILGTYEQLQKSVLVVTANLFYANQLADDLRNYTPDVFVYPVDEMISAEMAFSSPEARAERVATLNAALAQKRGFTFYLLPVFVVLSQV